MRLMQEYADVPECKTIVFMVGQNGALFKFIRQYPASNYANAMTKHTHFRTNSVFLHLSPVRTIVPQISDHRKA